jgi:hypothetical protein
MPRHVATPKKGEEPMNCPFCAWKKHSQPAEDEKMAEDEVVGSPDAAGAPRRKKRRMKKKRQENNIGLWYAYAALVHPSTLVTMPLASYACWHEDGRERHASRDNVTSGQ